MRPYYPGWSLLASPHLTVADLSDQLLRQKSTLVILAHAVVSRQGLLVVQLPHCRFERLRSRDGSNSARTDLAQ
jgi:hypothetical protein